MLTIENLYKSFGKLVAVNDFNLHVKEGETAVLMGPSGCGKSTMIRMINRLIEPDSGRICVSGTEITKLDLEELRRVRKRIGFVFQQFNLIGRLTAVENVMLGLVMDGIPRDAAYDKAMEALEKVGLEKRAQHKSAEMSGGQQQRVGIARALAFEPELMLWDEPTASLDPILVREVLVIMEELAKYRASSMLVVTHEISFAIHVADRIILMDKGSIVEEGMPEDVFGNPASHIGQQYKELIEYQQITNARTLNSKNIA
ncbi:amino acid ABC transporter ATP-binding protein [Pelosinus fermentans]|uniref:Phosphonate-transporting ATPase n=1 Tax=Pelosinus fermentans JBW45 TaxID=1192197 RepID=I9DDL5_9FIRM|nr:amino acid ABC transporter ATP-binding protein [Pelosinus fermentans]AJQ25958.1 Phosphonate-transporting ATPase [Pelosinus fermentans JBW45]